MFQQSVARIMAFGVQGEMAYTNAPSRAFPYQLISNPNPNIIGATAYTEVSEGIAEAGGVGPFAGVLVNPKVYANLMGLTPSMTLPDDVIGELANLGYYTLLSSTACNPGDSLVFNQATGSLSTVARGTAVGSTFTQIGTVELRSGAAAGLIIGSIHSVTTG